MVITWTWLVVKSAICAGSKADAWDVVSAANLLSVSSALRTWLAVPSIAIICALVSELNCASLSASTCAVNRACILTVVIEINWPVCIAASWALVSLVTLATLKPAIWLRVKALSCAEVSATTWSRLRARKLAVVKATTSAVSKALIWS